MSSTLLASQVIAGISNRNNFTLDPTITGLLIIDVQDYLSTKINKVQDAHDDSIASNSSSFLFDVSLPKVLPNIVQLVSTVRKLRDQDSERFCSRITGCEVIFTFLQALTYDCRDVSLDYKLSGPTLATRLPNPTQPATFDTLPVGLQPSPTLGRGDILVPKTSCSVFNSTNLDYILRNLGVEQLVICGQLTDQCIESAVRDAADLGYFVSVVDDACAALSEDSHNKGLFGMKGFARIVSTDTVIQELITASDVMVATTKSKASPAGFCASNTASFDVSVSPSSCIKAPIIKGTFISPSTNEQTSTDQLTTGTLDAILALLDNAGVEFLRFASVDISNAIRTKVVPISRLLNMVRNNAANNQLNDESFPYGTFELNNKVTIATANMGGLPSYGDTIIPETELDARHVLSLHPDISTLRILPYAPKSAMMLCSLWERNPCKQISPFCTRSLLRRVLHTAYKEFKIGFNIGAEIEFCLYHYPDSASNRTKLHPIDKSLFAYPTTLNEQEEYISEVCQALAKQSIQVELIHTESAFGQLEVVLPYETNPLKLADNIVSTKETIREVAKKRNMRAIFLPKVHEMQAGNGMHLHLSIRGPTISKTSDHSCAKISSNLFPGSMPGTISDIGGSFMEGILEHLPSLLALTAPTSNSFRRIGPGCWTGSMVSWDVENKETAIRVCLDVDSGMATNVEFKLSDSTANIYLELAALLWTGLDGIQRSLKLRPMHGASRLDCSDNKPLPSNLTDALQNLIHDTSLSNLLGNRLLTSYVAVKRAEIKHYASYQLVDEVIEAFERS